MLLPTRGVPVSDPTQPMPPGQPPQQPGPAQNPAPSQLPGPPQNPAPHQGTGQHPNPGPPHDPGPPYGAGPTPEPRPSMWRQAVSTTGGRVATVIAIALTGLLLLSVLAVGIFALARMSDDRGDRADRVGQNGMPLPGPRGEGERDRGEPGERGDGLGNGSGMMRRNGPLPGLGAVEHGEFTVRGSDGQPVVMTVQRGEVTSATAGSVAVKSADGFTETYVVNDQTRVQFGDTADLEAGDQIHVIARKEGKVAVVVRRA
jgi:hypothetical protein